jgi:uncharacterized membrane protein
MTGMDREDETSRNIGFGKNRIETLTDGIFAFSMTLLVTGIEIPKEVGGFITIKEYTILQEIFPDVIHYIIAFLVIAIFWYIHHLQFHRVLFVDMKLLWINVIMLLFIALIPFSTSFVGDFPVAPLAQIIFELNMFIIGIFLYWEWSYATSYHHLIDPTVTGEIITIGKYRALVLPLLSAAGIGLSLMSLPWSTLVYILAPVFLVLLHMKE